MGLCALYKECPQMKAHEQVGSIFRSGVIMLSGNTEQARTWDGICIVAYLVQVDTGRQSRPTGPHKDIYKHYV